MHQVVLVGDVGKEAQLVQRAVEQEVLAGAFRAVSLLS